MKRLLAAGLAGALLLAGAGCAESVAKDKDPSVKPGTTIGSADIKPARPNAGGKAVGE